MTPSPPLMVHCALWHINTVSYVTTVCHITMEICRYTPLSPTPVTNFLFHVTICNKHHCIWVIMIVFCHNSMLQQIFHTTISKSNCVQISTVPCNSIIRSPEVWWLILEYVYHKKKTEVIYFTLGYCERIFLETLFYNLPTRSICVKQKLKSNCLTRCTKLINEILSTNPHQNFPDSWNVKTVFRDC